MLYLYDPDFAWSIQRVSNEWVASKWIYYGSGASVNGRPKHIHACATPSCPEVFGIPPVIMSTLEMETIVGVAFKKLNILYSAHHLNKIL